MIRKVAVDRLVPGMFVHDLNCNGSCHTFAADHFLIDSPQCVGAIRRLGVGAIYIDTERGSDDRQPAPQEGAPPPRVALLDELQRALEVQSAAIDAVRAVYDDLRQSRPLAPARLEPVVDAMIDSLERNRDALISLGRLREMGQYAYEHPVGVSVLLMALGRALGMPRAVLRQLGIGALLHDVGKIRIPPAILDKPGPLDEHEHAVLRTHAVWGDHLLAQHAGISRTARTVVAQHHERLDGSGYPLHLKGNEISEYGRMAAIVDVFDSLCSDRCYQRGMAPTAVLRHLLEASDTLFDSRLVQHFVHCLGIYPVGSLVRLASGRLAVVTENGGNEMLRPKVRAVYDAEGRRPIEPVDIDLSRTGRHEERILSYEDPAAWGITPFAYLAL